MSVADDKRRKVATDTQSECNDMYFWDVSQNAFRNQNMSTVVPTLLCKSCIWCEQLSRILVPMEMLACQGLPWGSWGVNVWGMLWALASSQCFVLPAHSSVA
eukprot:15107703-Alexandrium_andersonii.AAC.1